jgi:hypothetical protein
MPAEFHEVLATYGVDDDGDPPGMIVPVNGANLVALEGGANLNVVPERDIVTVQKLAPAELSRALVQLNHAMRWVRGGRALRDDAVVFSVKAQRTGGADGTKLWAVDSRGRKVGNNFKAVVLGNRQVKIAIQPVKVRDDAGNWVFHAAKQFDAKELRDQMNMIWTPQANVVFDLVSSDPCQIEEKELAEALKKAGVQKSAFLEAVHIQAFAGLFVGKRHPDAHLTFFPVKSILDKELSSPNAPTAYPAGATWAPKGEQFTLVCDQMALDRVRQSRGQPSIPGMVLAHEAGHFLGQEKHSLGANAPIMLMVHGGPIDGFGKIPFDKAVNVFNKKY